VLALERPAEPLLARLDRRRRPAVIGEDVAQPGADHGLVLDDQDRELRIHRLRV